MHNNRHNRETVIIPQTIIVPTKSIIVASLVCSAHFISGKVILYHPFLLANSKAWVAWTVFCTLAYNVKLCSYWSGKICAYECLWDILSVFAEQHVLIAPEAGWFWLLSNRMDGHIQYSFKIRFKCNSNCSVLHYKVKHAEKCICTKQCLPLRVETKWDFDGMIINSENIMVSGYHGKRY